MKGAKRKHGKQLKGKAAKRDAKKEARKANSTSNSSKPGAKPSGKPGGKPQFGGKQGKHKMTGERKGQLQGNLRLEPIVFVPATHNFELKLELDKSSEDPSRETSTDPSADPSRASSDYPSDSDEPSDASGSSDSEEADENSMESDETSGGAYRDVSVYPSVDMSLETSAEASAEASVEPNVELSAEAGASFVESPKEELEEEEASAASNADNLAEDSHISVVEQDSEVLRDTTPDSKNTHYAYPRSPDSSELLGSMDDDELDAMIDEDVKGTERLELQNKHQPVIDEHSDSDIDSISDFEGEQRDWDPSFTQEEEPPMEEEEEEEMSQDEDGDSEDDSERLRITLDDYDLSDAGSAEQDYVDNMSDLDDDQIFALAKGNLQQNSVYDHEDMDVFDKYDEYDEYFDELIAGDEAVDQPQRKGGVSDRKKLKRQAREMMHTMKFGKLPLLWQRYPDEIHVREVLAEIRNFANQHGASLAFPPLDNNANWYVKQLAQGHGMRPTVEGSHMQKYVVAHRTRRTSALAGKGINKLLTRRQNFKRSDMKDDKKKKGKKGESERNQAGAKVRHGHIVGQNASEISSDNFGHRLMKQMGWTEGSGLGKERGGIVAPVPATVKLTKTGLGGI